MTEGPFKKRLPILLICMFLAVATLAVYAQTVNHGFLDFDDEEYIVANPHVRTGLTGANVLWAFASAHSNNWHPLTWISHMVDMALFGLKPGGHHLVNVLLHAVNAILLFLLLLRMTGALWRSAFVAALFALHPLHVESVAWAAERKDVLSACFWFLTIWAYVRYVQKRRWQRYVLALVCFALGLMAKQMLVTLPFVLLLLDYWPLGRFTAGQTFSGTGSQTQKNTPLEQQDKKGKNRPQRKAEAPPSVSGMPWQSLLIEKIPFLILAVLASVTVFLVQLKSGVLYDLNPFPLQLRLENAVVSYVAYLGKMFWPLHLAVFYPHPLHTLPLWKTLGALGLLILMTILCVKWYRKPYLSVGWFWYLGTLVPVIGLVQVGVQAMADRYSYIPLIGIFIMLAWGVPELFRKWRYGKYALATLAAVMIILCGIQAWHQTRTWKDRVSLYAHAARVVPDNYWAYNNLGAALAAQGRMDEAETLFLKSLKIMPLYPGANKNMAVLLYKKGRYNDALPYAQKALSMQPGNPEYLVILGSVWMKLGLIPEAITQFEKALTINPAYALAREALQEAMVLRDGAGRK